MAGGKKLEATLRLAADVANALAGLREVRKEVQATRDEAAAPVRRPGGSQQPAAATPATDAAAAAAAAAKAQQQAAATTQAHEAAAARRSAADRKAAAEALLAQRAAARQAAAERRSADNEEQLQRQKAAAQRTRDDQQSQGAVQRLRAGVQSISQTLLQARVQVVALFAAQVGVRQISALAQLADGYASMTARLRIVTQGQQEYNASLETTRLLARRYVQPQAETTALYTRMLAALRPLGGGLREATVSTEALLASLRISGAAASESGSAILQFSQAMAAGALRGEEFNAIAEAAPRLLDALAAGLGKPRSELKALAEQGQLTSSAVVQALARELPRLRAEAATIPDTIGSATQGVRNAMLQLVGATAQGSQGVRVIVGALALLRDNLATVLTALTAVAVGLAALKLGVFAQGLYLAGKAAVVAAGGVAVFGAAAKGALAFITGPVGWIVALAAAAAAWLGLRDAKQKASQRTLDVVQRELADAQAELAAAREATAAADRQSVLRASAQQRGEVTLADGRVRRLQRELDLLRDQQAAEQELERLARRGSLAGADLASPKVVADTQQKYQTRLAVEKQFAAERAAYIIAKDKEIERARAGGSDAAFVAGLERQKTDTLALLEKQRRDALTQFDNQGQATRAAQAKAAFDAELALLADRIEREKAANQGRYDEGLSDLASYLQRRADLEGAAHELRVRQLQQQLAAEDKALTANRTRLTRAQPGNEREGLADAVAAGESRRAELQVDIAKALRDQQDAEQARLRLVREVNRELALQREAVRTQIEDVQGQPLSPERLRERALEANRATLDKLRNAGDIQGAQQVLQLVDLQAAQAELQQLEALVGQTRQRLTLGEDELQRQVASGALTAAEGEREVLRLRQAQLPLLEQMLARMRALATSDGDRLRVAELEARVAALRDAGQTLEQTLRGQAVNGLAQMLVTVSTGAKTAKEALLDMVRSFAQALLNVLAQRLAEKLIKQMTEASGSASGGQSGGWIGALATWVATLFHSGGVVGEHAGARRRLPAAAFAFAPRYHSGGIAGMGPGEVPAVLKRGEEVLTADDPRHRNNLRGGAGGRPLIGNLNVSVSTDGTGSAAGDAGLAQRLAALIKNAIEQKLADEMRPGGMLQNVQRA